MPLRALVALLLFYAVAAHAVSLDPPNKGFVAAPIHSEAFHYKLRLATRWPEGKPKPEIVGKSLYLAWDGAPSVKTLQDRPYPMLFVKLNLLVPVSAQVTTASSDRALTSKPYDSGRDQFEFNLAIRRMAGNTAEFFVRFHDGTVAEFQLEYGFELSETVFGVDSRCANYGVRVDETTSGKSSGYFFASCYYEDGILYIGILKPLDRTFVLSDTSNELIKTSNQPVIRLVLSERQDVKYATIGEMRIEDAKKNSERYVVSYVPRGVAPSRFSATAGLSTGVVRYSESEARGPKLLSEAVVTGKLTLGFQLVPGMFDASISVNGTLIPIVLSPQDKPSARFIGANYRVGYTLPFKWNDTSLAVMTGWYSWYMIVARDEYGVPNMTGPQIYLAARHGPLGELGWTAYVKYVPFIEAVTNYELAAGFAHDLPWIWAQTQAFPRRPALTVDFASFGATMGDNVARSVVVTVGLNYPLM